MEYITLGRTGLQASVLGLGGGGHSRLGVSRGAGTAESVGIVRHALDLGVNFIDTAEAYGTEPLVGEALRDVDRQTVILSTKKSPTEDNQPINAARLTLGLEQSLARLQTDYVDIYHLHGVRADRYDHAVDELVPALLRLREQGKIRFLGITEHFGGDTGHAMMSRAVRDDYWDVVMVGFSILNQSARERVFVETQRRNIGVLGMFAVRDALSRPEKLRETIAELVQQGQIAPDALDAQDPLGFILQDGDVASVPEAAYRFCRAEPGMHVVLSGTGNPQHLDENVAAILRPPLSPGIHQRLVDIFAGIDTVSGQ